MRWTFSAANLEQFRSIRRQQAEDEAKRGQKFPKTDFISVKQVDIKVEMHLLNCIECCYIYLFVQLNNHVYIFLNNGS